MKLHRVLLVILVIQLTVSMAIPSISGAAEQVVPSEPSGVGGSNWHGFAHITWQEPGQTGPGITHYLVYRSVNGTDVTLATELGDSARAYQEMMPPSAVNVTYWVVAQNAIGTGNPSANVTLVPNEFPSAPHRVMGHRRQRLRRCILGLVRLERRRQHHWLRGEATVRSVRRIDRDLRPGHHHRRPEHLGPR